MTYERMRELIKTILEILAEEGLTIHEVEFLSRQLVDCAKEKTIVCHGDQLD